jgi:3-hydroxyisobutyrate dehydrogenase
MPVADQLLPCAGSAANNDHEPGFAAALMLKDITRTREAAQPVHAHRARGAGIEIYAAFESGGKGASDFSGIVNFVRLR